MTRILLTGMGAGAAAALLFASVTSGVGLSVVLFYLAPLPIMIVALGWSHWAGLLAAMGAAAMLGGAFGSFLFVIFLTSVGAPAWWVGYLALLGRPVAHGQAPHMEWYPPGRLVLWAAVIGAAVTAGALATFGSDEASIRHGLRDALDQILQPQTAVSGGRSASIGPPATSRPPGPVPAVEGAGTQVPASQAPGAGGSQGPAADAPAPDAQPGGADNIDPMVDLLARVLPPAAAVIAALTQAANLWLAGLAVRLSGRLRRPWPDLTALSFPPVAALLYGICLAGTLLPGLPGLVTSLFAATLTMAFTMVGFAVLHAATRGMQGRPFILWGTYGFVLFLLWPVLVMTVVGVAETLFGLRGRFSRRGPPAARTP